MKRALCFITIILSNVLFGCGYNDFGALAHSENDELVVNADIGDLKAYYNREKERREIYDNVVIGGYVTANDVSGNFYRTFIIEDHTGAIEIKSGQTPLHNNFSIGRYVKVKCEGLSVGLYNEVLQIGLEPIESGNKKLAPDYFGFSPSVTDRYVVRTSTFDHTIPPLNVTVSGLNEGTCGKLVRIKGLKLVVTEQQVEYTWAEPREDIEQAWMTGYRIFATTTGDKIAVVTSGYADFAKDIVPKSEVTLTGILSYGKTNSGATMYLLKKRSRYDVEAY